MYHNDRTEELKYISLIKILNTIVHLDNRIYSDSIEDLEGHVSPQSVEDNFTFKTLYFNTRWILFLHKINQLEQNLGCSEENFCSEAPLM